MLATITISAVYSGFHLINPTCLEASEFGTVPWRNSGTLLSCFLTQLSCRVLRGDLCLTTFNPVN